MYELQTLLVNHDFTQPPPACMAGTDAITLIEVCVAFLGAFARYNLHQSIKDFSNSLKTSLRYFTVMRIYGVLLFQACYLIISSCSAALLMGSH